MFYRRTGLAFKASLTLVVAWVVFVFAAPDVNGHEWTLGKDREKVKAKAVDFTGQQVLLETDQGERISVAINELVAEDLAYLKDLVLIRSSEIQLRLAEEQNRQLRLKLMAKYVDIWTVTLVAPNGQTAIRNYFAVNSVHAKNLAWQEFPTARIMGVRRVQPANAQGGTGSNSGLIPELMRIQNGVGPRGN